MTVGGEYFLKGLNLDAIGLRGWIGDPSVEVSILEAEQTFSEWLRFVVPAVRAGFLPAGVTDDAGRLLASSASLEIVERSHVSWIFPSIVQGGRVAVLTVTGQNLRAPGQTLMVSKCNSEDGALVGDYEGFSSQMGLCALLVKKQETEQVYEASPFYVRLTDSSVVSDVRASATVSIFEATGHMSTAHVFTLQPGGEDIVVGASLGKIEAFGQRQLVGCLFWKTHVRASAVDEDDTVHCSAPALPLGHSKMTVTQDLKPVHAWVSSQVSFSMAVSVIAANVTDGLREHLAVRAAVVTEGSLKWICSESVSPSCAHSFLERALSSLTTGLRCSLDGSPVALSFVGSSALKCLVTSDRPGFRAMTLVYGSMPQVVGTWSLAFLGPVEVTSVLPHLVARSVQPVPVTVIGENLRSKGDCSVLNTAAVIQLVVSSRQMLCSIEQMPLLDDGRDVNSAEPTVVAVSHSGSDGQAFGARVLTMNAVEFVMVSSSHLSEASMIEVDFVMDRGYGDVKGSAHYFAFEQLYCMLDRKLFTTAVRLHEDARAWRCIVPVGRRTVGDTSHVFEIASMAHNAMRVSSRGSSVAGGGWINSSLVGPGVLATGSAVTVSLSSALPARRSAPSLPECVYGGARSVGWLNVDFDVVSCGVPVIEQGFHTMRIFFRDSTVDSAMISTDVVGQLLVVGNARMERVLPLLLDRLLSSQMTIVTGWEVQAGFGMGGSCRLNNSHQGEIHVVSSRMATCLFSSLVEMDAARSGRISSPVPLQLLYKSNPLLSDSAPIRIASLSAPMSAVPLNGVQQGGVSFAVGLSLIDDDNADGLLRCVFNGKNVVTATRTAAGMPFVCSSPALRPGAATLTWCLNLMECVQSSDSRYVVDLEILQSANVSVLQPGVTSEGCTVHVGGANLGLQRWDDSYDDGARGFTVRYGAYGIVRAARDELARLGLQFVWTGAAQGFHVVEVLMRDSGVGTNDGQQVEVPAKAKIVSVLPGVIETRRMTAITIAGDGFRYSGVQVRISRIVLDHDFTLTVSSRMLLTAGISERCSGSFEAAYCDVDLMAHRVEVSVDGGCYFSSSEQLVSSYPRLLDVAASPVDLLQTGGPSVLVAGFELMEDDAYGCVLGKMWVARTSSMCRLPLYPGENLVLPVTSSVLVRMDPRVSSTPFLWFAAGESFSVTLHPAHNLTATSIRRVAPDWAGSMENIVVYVDTVDDMRLSGAGYLRGHLLLWAGAERMPVISVDDTANSVDVRVTVRSAGYVAVSLTTLEYDLDLRSGLSMSVRQSPRVHAVYPQSVAAEGGEILTISGSGLLDYDERGVVGSMRMVRLQSDGSLCTIGPQYVSVLSSAMWTFETPVRCMSEVANTKVVVDVSTNGFSFGGSSNVSASVYLRSYVPHIPALPLQLPISGLSVPLSIDFPPENAAFVERHSLLPTVFVRFGKTVVCAEREAISSQLVVYAPCMLPADFIPFSFSFNIGRGFVLSSIPKVLSTAGPLLNNSALSDVLPVSSADVFDPRSLFPVLSHSSSVEYPVIVVGSDLLRSSSAEVVSVDGPMDVALNFVSSRVTRFSRPGKTIVSGFCVRSVRGRQCISAESNFAPLTAPVSNLSVSHVGRFGLTLFVQNHVPVSFRQAFHFLFPMRIVVQADYDSVRNSFGCELPFSHALGNGVVSKFSFGFLDVVANSFLSSSIQEQNLNASMTMDTSPDSVLFTQVRPSVAGYTAEMVFRSFSLSWSFIVSGSNFHPREHGCRIVGLSPVYGLVTYVGILNRFSSGVSACTLPSLTPMSNVTVSVGAGGLWSPPRSVSDEVLPLLQLQDVSVYFDKQYRDREFLTASLGRPLRQEQSVYCIYQRKVIVRSVYRDGTEFNCGSPMLNTGLRNTYISVDLAAGPFSTMDFGPHFEYPVVSSFNVSGVSSRSR
jgi:hypothetical protein